MNALRVPPFLILIFWLTACAGPKVEQDYNPDTDFDRDWVRYDWRGSQSQVPGYDAPRLKRTAEQALMAQGYQLDPDNPDFLVDISALTRAATGGGKSLGLSIGLPVGRHGSVGIGGSKNLDDEQRQEGVIIVDLTEADSGQLLWRGSASGIPLKDFELGRQDQLQQTLERLLAQFPPES